ncbi:FmdB family zinc ribbon protein [Haladaptatus cibarius]|nr:hypothetical protein [Haladaptatus cibarius]
MSLRRLINRLRNNHIDYVCANCGRAFDLPLDACPSCEGEPLHRIVK